VPFIDFANHAADESGRENARDSAREDRSSRNSRNSSSASSAFANCVYRYNPDYRAARRVGLGGAGGRKGEAKEVGAEGGQKKRQKQVDRPRGGAFELWTVKPVHAGQELLVSGMRLGDVL
jgi:hypothetical protein